MSFDAFISGQDIIISQSNLDSIRTKECVFCPEFLIFPLEMFRLAYMTNEISISFICSLILAVYMHSGVLVHLVSDTQCQIFCSVKLVGFENDPSPQEVLFNNTKMRDRVNLLRMTNRNP